MELGKQLRCFQKCDLVEEKEKKEKGFEKGREEIQKKES